ncbi:MAG: branched-chain amino acid ABC transporter permease [Candidatus Bathyarchaeota archaeon]|nr:branched-chain amino acid ABC transporter permease [Candidatus Bathyarchaeota archaeon]
MEKADWLMLDATTIILTLIWGVAIGSIYVLLATGLNLIFGVMKLVNFAHGQLLMIGAYIGFTVWSIFGVNAYLAIFFAMASVAIIGILVERFSFRRVLGEEKLNEIFVSLGLILLFDNVAVLLWGEKSKRIISPFENMSVLIGELSISYDWLIAMAIVVVMLISLIFLIKKTKIGLAMRATSQRQEASMLMGINVERIYILTFAIGAAMAGAAGVLFGIIFPFNPYIGALPTIKAFAIIILGGLGSIPGAIIGGLLYGIAEQSAVIFLGGIWRNAIAFTVLIIVLIFRPKGLFGEKGE